MYPGQQYRTNQQYQQGGPPPQGYGPQSYYPPPPGPPPPGMQWQNGPPQQQHQYYAPPPGAPPPNMNSHPQYHPPSGPPPPQGNIGYGQGQYGAPPPPPTSAQMFHQQVGQGYTFQYSQCNGKRKALLIGINYFGTPQQLKGCINDVKNMSQFMHDRYRFAWDDMVILTDDQKAPRSLPTRANILRAMDWLVSGAQPNDNLFFHYSGHGGQTEDRDGDEEDGMDETIYPMDFKQAGMIVDDEMHQRMVRPLPPGCRLTAVFDCCHSGSALDLPYEYGAQGTLKEPNLLAEAGQGLLGAGLSYLRGDMSGVVSAGTQLFKKITTGSSAREKARQTKTSPADVIQFSGCKDYQTSADAVEGGEATGAMSWAFREVLTRKPQQSYHELLVNVRELLAGKYQQKPVLSASHPIDTKLLFII